MMNEIKKHILHFMGQADYVPCFPSQMRAKIGIPELSTGKLERALKQLESEGQIARTARGKIVFPEQAGFYRGIFAGSSRGFGFVSRAGESEDIFIPPSKTLSALPGDEVMLRILRPASRDGRAEGVITRILTRAHEEITGTLSMRRSQPFGLVYADDTHIANPVKIMRRDLAGAKAGDKVRVRISTFSDNPKTYHIGRVDKIYGDADTTNANYESVLDVYGIPRSFPPEVLHEAATVAAAPSAKEIAGRTDLRGEIIFTIDGADSKDLDDAVSIKRLEQGYELGVHIADVTHYVRENSALDTQAQERGTSVYFADQVVPMLPPVLSNGVCSLSPGEDRLCLSAIMRIDRKGDFISYRIEETVIRSRVKGVYSEINTLFDGGAAPAVVEKYRPVWPSLQVMKELYQILDRAAKRRGALDFETSESKIIVEDGVPVDIVPRSRGTAEKMIEEFMIMANRATAKFAYDAEIPFMYRVHEDPSPERVENLRAFLKVRGLTLKRAEQAADFSQVLDGIRGTADEKVLSELILRCMAKARYAGECIGHFGLALRYYCHFTSPIRRYPDEIAHRILKDKLHGKLSEKRLRRLEKIVAESAKSSTDAEIRAMGAERAIEDLYKAVYMLPKLGETFTGIISSVAKHGIYVELPSTVEGLVRIADISDDYYDFEPHTLSFLGRAHKRRFAIGDTVHVRLAGVNIASGQIDFDLLD